MHKIIHMTSVHTPHDTRIFYKQCRTLATEGFPTALIAVAASDSNVEGVDIISVRKHSGRVLRFLKTGLEIFRVAMKEQASVYHIHDPELLPWGQALRLRKKKVIFDMHENMPAAIRTKPWIHPLLRNIVASAYQMIERKLLAGMAVIFAEESYRALYPDLGTDNIVVLNVPIFDEIASIEAVKYDAPTVGYIGGVSPKRGSLTTARALQLLNEKTKIDWECIGPVDDHHKDELIEAFGRKNSGGIRLRGRMKLIDGLQIIAKCHIGLAILEKYANFYESFPTKMFEYMAMGMPVIASDFPLYRRVIDQARCGFCVDPGNPEEIAEAIAWLIQNPGEAQAMGERGREAVRKYYDWKHEGKKLLDLYARLFSEKSSEEV